MSYSNIPAEILGTTVFGSVELHLKYLNFGGHLGGSLG